MTPYLKTLIAVLAFSAGIFTASSGQCAVSDQHGRFFWMGSGDLHLKNLRNGKEATVELLAPDGSISEAALTEVDRVFGFPTSEKGEHISPRLLFMLSYFSDLVAPGRMIIIESGYRSPDYNDKIRKKGANAARTSTHIDGMALDFRIAGVDGKGLWQTVREKDCCGVGHYGGEIIHLDAGRPRFWEAATSGTGKKEPDYNRHIYLSTDYDRYKPSDAVRLSLSGISTFGFGIRPTVHLHDRSNAAAPAALLQIAAPEQSDCLKIDDRRKSRFLTSTLPSEMAAGRYTIELEFCEKPFSQMPAVIFSHEIEVLKHLDQ